MNVFASAGFEPAVLFPQASVEPGVEPVQADVVTAATP